jgi:hypothetical protein
MAPHNTKALEYEVLRKRGFESDESTCREKISQTMIRRRRTKSNHRSNRHSDFRDSNDEFHIRDIHDFFNLIVLIPIVVLDILNWNWQKLNASIIFGKKSSIPFEMAFAGEYFDIFFNMFTGYIIIDSLWIVLDPRSVKSPSMILKHHIAVLLYLIIPTLYPKLNFMMAILVSVELNTWFLIARRVYNKQGLKPWKVRIPILPAIHIKFLSICFYASWFAIRVVLYPYVYYIFYRMWNGTYLIQNDIPLWAMGASIIFHTGLCFLNCSWTLDLCRSKLRQWNYNGTTDTISSGL